MQFTPDLLPSDVVGPHRVEPRRRQFEFRPGPVFNNVVLADEINRASPKTQAALLEAMAEGQVTVDGATYPLSPPFMVIATQNPIEHEGTYPLPESQLDRFLMRVSVGYPAPEAELEILDTHGDHDAYRDIGPVVGNDEVGGMATAARACTWRRPQGVPGRPGRRDARHAHLALGMSPAPRCAAAGGQGPRPPRAAPT